MGHAGWNDVVLIEIYSGKLVDGGFRWIFAAERLTG
jgi:hypothetical protein